MSGWSELSSLGVTVRPLSEPAIPIGGRYSAFGASLTSTVRTLATELRALSAKRIVLELDLRERDLRADGLPRADARVRGPAVRVSFESQWGPVRFGTGEFGHWHENLRAIALSMEALRKVDRYGVSRRGEQYQGWKQLTAANDVASRIVTADQAQEFVSRWMTPEDDLTSGVRKALKATHPDTGDPGEDGEDFRAVLKAKQLLGL